MLSRYIPGQSMIGILGVIIASAIVAAVVVQFIPGSGQASPHLNPPPFEVTPVATGKAAAEVSSASDAAGFPVIQPGALPAGYKLASVTTTKVGQEPDVELRYMRVDADGQVDGDISLEELNIRLNAPAKLSNGAPDRSVATGFSWADVWETADHTAYTVLAGHRTYIVRVRVGSLFDMETLLDFISSFKPA